MVMNISKHMMFSQKKEDRRKKWADIAEKKKSVSAIFSIKNNELQM